MIINHVKFYRKQRGLSQAELAKKIGVSRNSISSIERGEYIPSLETAFELCEALFVVIHELFDYKDDTDDSEYEKPIEPFIEKQEATALLNSTLDALINKESDFMALAYKKIRYDKALEHEIERTRYLVNFYAFMQSHGIAAFMDYLERKDIFKVEENDRT
ncbi:MAG: helix-turn-helix transcriptional regulator [Clostridia bacterium]|nr:helix-turn-helix transcriptional regulator [Clostridia bacterium]